MSEVVSEDVLVSIGLSAKIWVKESGLEQMYHDNGIVEIVWSDPTMAERSGRQIVLTSLTDSQLTNCARIFRAINDNGAEHGILVWEQMGQFANQAYYVSIGAFEGEVVATTLNNFQAQFLQQVFEEHNVDIPFTEIF